MIKYGDKVRVTRGFYVDNKGIAVAVCRDSNSLEPISYYITLDDGTSVEISEIDLEKVGD